MEWKLKKLNDDLFSQIKLFDKPTINILSDLYFNDLNKQNYSNNDIKSLIIPSKFISIYDLLNYFINVNGSLGIHLENEFYEISKITKDDRDYLVDLHKKLFNNAIYPNENIDYFIKKFLSSNENIKNDSLFSFINIILNYFYKQKDPCYILELIKVYLLNSNNNIQIFKAVLTSIRNRIVNDIKGEKVRYELFDFFLIGDATGSLFRKYYDSRIWQYNKIEFSDQNCDLKLINAYGSSIKIVLGHGSSISKNMGSLSCKITIDNLINDNTEGLTLFLLACDSDDINLKENKRIKHYIKFNSELSPMTSNWIIHVIDLEVSRCSSVDAIVQSCKDIVFLTSLDFMNMEVN